MKELTLLFEIKNPDGKISENGFDYTMGNAYIELDFNDLTTEISGESENTMRESIEITIFDVVNKWVKGKVIHSQNLDNMRQDFAMARIINVYSEGKRFSVENIEVGESEDVGRSLRMYDFKFLLTSNINIGRNA